MIGVHPRFQCTPLQVRYDYALHRGIVFLQDDDCTDMTGAIAVFQQLDPDVIEIVTKNERGGGTTYICRHGRWSAERRRWYGRRLQRSEASR